MNIRTCVFWLLLFPALLHSQDFSKSLKQAYKKRDTAELYSLLMKWNTEVPSNENSLAGNNDTLAHVYAVYNAFYSPFDLKRVGKSEWGENLYLDKIAVIQNSLSYGFATFSDPNSHPISYEFGERTIQDFRPKTRIPKDRRLYLTDHYRIELQQFLGNQHKPLGNDGIMSPARATKSSAKRQAFLSPFLNIIQGHWGGYWHIETHPEVTQMILSPDMTKAVISFRLVYEGGEAYLERQEGEWKLIESHLTWIE